MTPFPDILRCAADNAVAAEVASISTPSEMAAFGVDLLQTVLLAHPAGAAEEMFGNSSAEDSADVPPAAVTYKALAHYS
jgi:hypothetical protein